MKKIGEVKENIGKVTLDYGYYSGEDLYSEGANEDLLLEAVKNYSEKDYEELILSYRSWSVMYHLSHSRENIISFLDINKDQDVLEIGSGCGAVTGSLCHMAGSVTCIELSKKRSLINAYRHREADNLSILVGNFEDIEEGLTRKFDIITLIGVLEYAESYIRSSDPYSDLLGKIKKHLKPGGRLVIAIENKYGLKYFAGCKEDHTDRYFEGIEGYSSSRGVRTFSREGLLKLLEKEGLKGRFYYPYPDYKLCSAVYSDEWLPKEGELDRNLVNYDMDRVVCFDEKKAFDELIREGRFADHSNSFLVLAGLLESEAEKEYPIYAKYSDERNEKYRIVTVITNKGSKRGVYKKALSKASTDHIKALKDNYKKLSKMYGESLFTPDHCNTENEKENEAEFEYLSGITFKEYLNSLEEKKEYDSMLKLILKFKDLLLGIYKEDFKNTEENDKAFKEVFGDIYRGEDKTAPLSDIDLIFENIVFDKEGLPFGKWSVLDYEWTLDFKIPLKFIIYRSLFYYLRDKKESSFLDYLSEKNIDLYELMGIDEREKEEIFPGFEESFQLYIKRGTVSFGLIYEVMPTKALSLEKMVSDNLWRTNLKNPQIYASRERNRGFGPEDYIVAYGEYDELEKSITLKLELSEDIKEIRVDPTENECLLKVLNIELEEGERSDRASSKGRSIDSYLINGYPLSDSFFVFDHKDPQLVIRDLPDSKKILTISYIVSYPDTSVSEDIYSYFREEEERKDEEKRKKGIKGFFGVGRNEDLGPYSQYRYNR